MAERGIEARYAEAVGSFIEFARTLSDDDWATPVPCTPLWTARDVLSHVSGIPDDGLSGRMEGAPGEAWTAAQVERNAGFGVEELLTRWESQYETFATVLESIGEGRPPFDCHGHEHDIRHALGRPGNRDSQIIVDFVESLDPWFEERGVGLDASPFEVFRSRLGRRTREQVRALAWTGDDDAIDAALDDWFAFGPTEFEIVE